MRTYKKLTHSPLSVLRQAFILGAVSYLAVSLFPFVKYKDNNDTEPQINYRVEPNFIKVSNTEKTMGFHLDARTEDPKLAGSWNTNAIKQYFSNSSCPDPVIPSISTSIESEAKTVSAVNQWIDCQNSWNTDLNKLIQAKNNLSNERRNALDTVLKSLIAEDKANIERVAYRYAQWKKNSLSYKQRLGFRRNLITDEPLESQ